MRFIGFAAVTSSLALPRLLIGAEHLKWRMSEKLSSLRRAPETQRERITCSLCICPREKSHRGRGLSL